VYFFVSVTLQSKIVMANQEQKIFIILLLIRKYKYEGLHQKLFYRFCRVNIGLLITVPKRSI